MREKGYENGNEICIIRLKFFKGAKNYVRFLCGLMSVRERKKDFRKFFEKYFEGLVN
jgi:hypothetical protein